jgi:2-keto-4-pentenoate hydratase
MTASTDELARRLRDAYSGQTVPPMRGDIDPLDSDKAYAVQEINTRFWQSQGRRIIGRKIGLTAKAVQVQLGVDQPDYGVLFADMKVADQGYLDPSLTIQPKVEAEIALAIPP